MCIPNRFTSLLSVCLLMRAAFSVTVLQGVIMTPRWLTWQDLRQPGEHPDESGHDIQSISAAEPSAQDSAAFTFPTSCRTSQTGRHQFTLHYITFTMTSDKYCYYNMWSGGCGEGWKLHTCFTVTPTHIMAHSWTSLSLSHLLYYTVIFQFKSLFVIIFTHQNTQKKTKTRQIPLKCKNTWQPSDCDSHLSFWSWIDSVSSKTLKRNQLLNDRVVTVR